MSVRAAFRRLFRSAPKPTRRRPTPRLAVAELEGRAVPAAFGPLGDEFRVNTFTAGNQSAPVMATDAAGNFVVAWRSFGQEGPGLGVGVYAQRYSAAGAPLGDEFRVNTYLPGNQSAPVMAMGAAGNFVVAWHSFGQEGHG